MSHSINTTLCKATKKGLAFIVEPTLTFCPKAVYSIKYRC